VVNIESTVDAIKQAVSEAEAMAQTELAQVITGVGGGHVRGINSRGVVGVSGKHREVSQADVDRALEAARAIELPPDREVIHVLPQTYI
jgi:cell division protein FtsA